MQSGPCAGMVHSGAGQSGLAVRARGAGAGQDQVVDELALSDLIYGRSINQAERFAAKFAPRGRCRLFLLRLQFMFDGAGGAGDDGHRDEQTRGRHRCCTLFPRYACARAADVVTRRNTRLRFHRKMARGRVARVRRPRGTSSAALARASKSRVARLALRIFQTALIFPVSGAQGTPFGVFILQSDRLTFRRGFARLIPDARLSKMRCIPQSHQIPAKTGFLARRFRRGRKPA